MQNNRSRQNPSSGLSERETQVLELLAQGLGIEEIAGQLNIMPATVRNHVANLLNKLGAHSQLEAVITAFRLGLVKLPTHSQ
jgi:DNA-binding NarL/FixJ family response regulator